MKGKYIYDLNYDIKQSLKIVLGGWYVQYNRFCNNWKSFYNVCAAPKQLVLKKGHASQAYKMGDML